MRPRRTLAALALLAVTLTLTLVLLRRPPAPLHLARARADVTLPAPPPPPPVRVRRDGVPVALGGGLEMRETEPMLAPDDAPRPVTLLFHAICADPKWTCDWLQYSELGPEWQLCPRAPVACAGGGWQWTASADATLDLAARAMGAAKERHGARVDDGSIVLVGLSQGAYAVAAIVHALAREEHPRLTVAGIVLHGAHAHLAAADVLRLGARVALAAGELDEAAPAMRAEADALLRAGVTARFESLGKVGHFLPVESGTKVAMLIDWSRAR